MSTEENATPKPPLYKTIEVAWSKLAETLNAEAEAGYRVAHDLFRSVHDPNTFTVLLHWNESAIADAVRQRAIINMMSDLLDAAPAYIENLLAGQSATLPDWAKSPPAPPAEAQPAEAPVAEAPPAEAPAAP